MKSKLTAAFAVMVATLALFVGTAFAHSNHVRANCNIGVNIEAHAYPDTPAGASAQVTVAYDGAAVYTKQFSSEIKDNVPNPDKTKSHTYTVTFDRLNYTGTDGDKVWSGSIPACKEATTTTTTVAPTTTVAVTTTTIPVTATTVVAETTTVPAITTTTAVVTPASTVTPPAPKVSLPATGAASDTLLVLGGALFGFGLALVLLSRPRA